MTLFWSISCLVPDEVRVNRLPGRGRGAAANATEMTNLGEIPGLEGYSLESLVLGNGPAGFGGGSGETQFGCALCSYLTRAPRVRSAACRSDVKADVARFGRGP